MQVALAAVIAFLAGALVMLVQPMFARMILPLVGGAPAVWNTVMLCYQVLLLLGYLYAHALTTRVPIRWQRGVHAFVLLIPLLLLPIAVPAASLPPAGANPTGWVIQTVLVAAGLPFLVVSTTSPLVQRWRAMAEATGHSQQPYALYAAGNAGSLLGLLAYPLLLEPRLSVRHQSLVWAGGYVLLAALLVVFLRTMPAPQQQDAVTTHAATPSAARRARWVLLAFIPSALLLGVTQHLSTDIAPLPLLWVVPLTLYLLTFVLAFASRRVAGAAQLARLIPAATVPVMVSILADLSKPLWPIVALHLLSFAVIALASHTALAEDAPEPEHLTTFYLALAIGGALGGVCMALLAPLVFTSILEYPLTLVLAAGVLSAREEEAQQPAAPTARRLIVTPRLLMSVVVPLMLVPMVLLTDTVTREFGLDSAVTRRVVALGAPAAICYVLAGQRLRFGLGVLALLMGSAAFERSRTLLIADRSYFGLTRVYVTGGGRYHALVHGSISHGAQSLDAARRHEPLSYYTKTGPVGEIIIPRQRLGLVRHVAVVGLGAGSLACYRQPNETWTFFEIDEVVRRIATNPRYFTYLQDCAPAAPVVLGDARLSLTRSPDRAFDLILLDAYSADAIPVHLLTREALALYLRKLRPGGVLAFHISNQYFNLAPVIAALAADAGVVARFRDENVLTEAESARGKTTSDWMVVARRDADFGPLLALERWATVAPAASVWTDDFSSALSALR